MIEILDIRDAEPDKLDITPQLAVSAYNVLKAFCEQNGCTRCVFFDALEDLCEYSAPCNWPELEVPDD